MPRPLRCSRPAARRFRPGPAAVPLYGASRLGTLTRLDDGTRDYRYELNDQLGNDRVVYHRPTTVTYTATLETGAATQEEKDFRNLAATRAAVGISHGGSRVAALGQPTGQAQGPAKTLTVQRGDTVTFTAYAWLTAAGRAPARTSGARPAAPLALAVAPLVSSPAAGAPGTGNDHGPARSLNPLARVGLGVAVLFGQKTTAPTMQLNTLNGSTGNVFIRYRVLDANGQEVPNAGGTQEANGSTPGTWQQLQVGLRLQQAGTVELSVEVDGLDATAYVDDVQVDQTGSTIVQEQHTYAYGAPLAGLNYVIGTKKYRHGYQGQYTEKDEETGWDDFELRMYDSRIGRWTAPDPKGQFHSPYVGMGNNPVSGTDPDGGFAEWLGSFLGSVGIGNFVKSAGIAGTYYAPSLAQIGSVGFNIGLGAASTAVQAASQGPGRPPRTGQHNVSWGGVTANYGSVKDRQIQYRLDPLSTSGRHMMLSFTFWPMFIRGINDMFGLPSGNEQYATFPMIGPAGGLASEAEMLFNEAAVLNKPGSSLITKAGVAVSKHANYFGFQTYEQLQKVHRSVRMLNTLGSDAVEEMLTKGVRTTGISGSYPKGWITYTLQDGRAASWHADGSWIGFRGVR